MNIRKIIREEIQRLFHEDDNNTGGMFGSALDSIDTELGTDLTNVKTIIATHQTDIKNMDNEIKVDSQLKSKLDQNNPHRKGLEVEIPQKQKDFEMRKKQLKDLQDTQKGLEDAQTKIEKQQTDMQSQTKSGGKQATPSVLPSLPSAI